ncbi:hypothetical protein Micbo1qcDRAFT_168769, partial [Microdochium bolleyi]
MLCSLLKSHGLLLVPIVNMLLSLEDALLSPILLARPDPTACTISSGIFPSTPRVRNLSATPRRAPCPPRCPTCRSSAAHACGPPCGSSACARRARVSTSRSSSWRGRRTFRAVGMSATMTTTTTRLGCGAGGCRPGGGPGRTGRSLPGAGCATTTLLFYSSRVMSFVVGCDSFVSLGWKSVDAVRAGV